LRRRDLLKFLDLDGTTNDVQLLKQHIAGKNDSWAVRWRASVILADMLSLYPGRPLAAEIGLCGATSRSDPAVKGPKFLSSPVIVGDIPFRHSLEAYEALKRFHRRHSNRSLSRRMKERVERALHRAGLA
jgi:hypothetical protein